MFGESSTRNLTFNQTELSICLHFHTMPPRILPALTLFSRQYCGLCEDAKETLVRVQRKVGAPNRSLIARAVSHPRSPLRLPSH